ncbi:HNH endonuclease signature motif containing protein [Halobacteriovorax sp. XZX-3]|uniref:HNH endonuclease signature motif containing protein n=1 Tax=unclassified Halobacteriovorax TaxID=2639665 RepID=UPI0037148511
MDDSKDILYKKLTCLYEEHKLMFTDEKDFCAEIFSVAEYILRLRKQKKNYSAATENLNNLKEEISSKYIVNRDGTIFSKRRSKLLSSWITRAGYEQCSLSLTNNQSKTMYVHRLVALFHVENSGYFDSVNHIDGNRANNFYENLEWVSHKQNHLKRSQRNSGDTFGSNFCTKQKKWKACLQIHGGSFKKQKDADKKYNELHRIIYGYKAFRE